MSIKLKRIYDNPELSDGLRVLVDRLWPRGLSKEDAAIDEWMKDIAPSDRLRTWFGHKPERWKEFQIRYRRELAVGQKKEVIQKLKKISSISTVTLLFSAKDTVHNNAVALAHLLKKAPVPGN